MVNNQSKYRYYDNYNTKIYDTYKKTREHHTKDYVLNLHKKYLFFTKKIYIWHAFELLDKFIDNSDPDITLPNSIHLFQTAERIREDNKPEWMQVIGLIHDLGKMLYIKGCDEDGTSIKEQWSLVGDTYITGCKIPDSIVYSEFNTLNSDSNKYDELGIYTKHCGLDKCIFSFGHDEYLYQLLQYNIRYNKDTKLKNLPEEAFYIIRYHSCYLWHKENEYTQFENDKDKKMKPIVQEFNAYDLYSKYNKIPNIQELKKYYSELLLKYIGEYLYF
tara:strand:- start:4387 stop:5208 length:822 start_codon:yes stop_codon:yes gene_type:complete